MQAAHVLFEVGADDNDDGTGAEEEQSLEHGVGEEVEHGSHVANTAFAGSCGADTERYEHVGNL